MIDLKELVEALEFQSGIDAEEWVIEIATGKVFFISEDVRRYVETGETDYPDWQEEGVKEAQAYLADPEGFVPLPSADEVDEYQMMVDFAEGVRDDRHREGLLSQLRGKGAFRRFKDSVQMLQLEQEWYAFRDERYQQFAREWCEDNGFKVKSES
jgi:hypothetical protein